MRKLILLIVAIFVILTIIMTFPLCFRVTTCIPGFFSTDEPYAAIWDFWRIRHSLMHNISLMSASSIAYPFGVDLQTGYFSYLWMGMIYLLNLIMKPILVFNFQILLNFVLRGVFIYALVYYLTRSKLSAALSGIAFTFCPYHFVRVWQHLGLTYTQWIPLCLFAAILLNEDSTRKRMILFLITTVLLFSFDFSIMYFGAVTLATFLIYTLFYKWKTKLFANRSLFVNDFKYFAKVAIAGLAVFIMLLPQFLPIFTKSAKGLSTSVASGFNPYHRPFNDLFTQSAKPLSYLLPATTHPVFGKFTEQFIGSPFYGVSFTEHTLYLGWVPLILAFIAWRRWRKMIVTQTSHVPRPTSNDHFYIGYFVLLAAVAWAFSQPPYFTFPYFKIYMPSFFMYKILPMFRAYCRFGIVVMLAVSVLAGFGLKFVLERFRTRKGRMLFTGFVCAFVLFEFLNFPPFKVLDLTKYPKVYDWLKQQKGDFAVAEYPLDADSPNEYYKFCQTIHEKKIINGSLPGSAANNAIRALWNISDPNSPRVLGSWGVKYVLVHRDMYEKNNDVKFTEEFERIKGRKIAGMEFIGSFGDPIDLYKVRALSGTLKTQEGGGRK